jgi:osmoprotectant transport system substrate-binding protein
MTSMRRPALVLGTGLLGAAMALTGCGDPGSSGGGGTTTGNGETGQTTAAGGECEPATSEELVVLEDDQGLQTVDNIISAINAEAASPELIAALDAANAALDTETLVELNRAVINERQTSANVAEQFVEEDNLTEGLSGGSGTIVVGAANFAENQTLAEIYADVLNAAGFDASATTIGNRELYLQALQSGEIQVVPEYVGTLTEFLNVGQNGADAEPLASGDLEETVAALEGLGEDAGLVFGEVSEAADQNAFAVTEAFAEANDLETLSDLAACSGGELVLGGPPECPERPFCQPGLEETYGIEFSGFRPLDAGGPLTKTALRQGEIQVGLIFSSDPDLGTATAG